MKITQVSFFAALVFAKCNGHNVRGTFYERLQTTDAGNMCVDNPVCAAQGLSEGACCPNNDGDYHSCCNRACSVHGKCNILANHCCPTVDNAELDCCDHQPALDAWANAPSSLPSDTPTFSPSLEPSKAPSTNPSGRPSATPSASPSSTPSASPSAGPTAGPSSSPSKSLMPSLHPSAVQTPPLPTNCSAPLSQYVSSIQRLQKNGGVMVFNFTSLLPSTGSFVNMEINLRGDYGEDFEFADTFHSNTTFIGKIDPDGECSNTYNSHSFVIDSQIFNAWLQNGVATFTLDASAPVGTFCRYNDAFIALCYETDVPSVAPSTAPSAKPSIAPSAGPTTSPSFMPSFGPSSAPTLSPSSAPTDLDRNAGGSPTAPIFVGGALCQENPSCAAEGLQGLCCPTKTGVNLDCCEVSRQESMASCSSNSQCAVLGLTGNCCPTNDGIQLDCCGSNQ